MREYYSSYAGENDWYSGKTLPQKENNYSHHIRLSDCTLSDSGLCVRSRLVARCGPAKAEVTSFVEPGQENSPNRAFCIDGHLTLIYCSLVFLQEGRSSQGTGQPLGEMRL